MTAMVLPGKGIKRTICGAAGIARSLRIYYGNPLRRRMMTALYSRYVRSGDLVFDIGAHVGDRIAAFRRLGARVVAIEPQPAVFRWLNLLYGRDSNVTLLQAAMGAEPGQTLLHVNRSNPTISTASVAFMAATRGASGWEGQSWDDTITVPTLTLDELIEEYGAPAFAKIDVEGYELNVLNGLSTPLSALSFEFTTIQRDLAMTCLDRLTELGPYMFNAAIGESHRLMLPANISASAMRTHIRTVPHEINSGDIYAQI